MARNFLPYPFAPYNGVYSSIPFHAKGSVGLGVSLSVNWNTYSFNGSPLGNANPNFNVIGNLNNAGPNSVSQLWTIKSVYVDNLGVSFPVYIFFPDTGYSVACPANSSGWFRVFTNARQIFIVALGMTNTSLSGLVSTRVFCTDIEMSSYLDQEIAQSLALNVGSDTLSEASTIPLPGFSAPALGDQYLDFNHDLTSGTPVPISQLGPFASRFLYITQVQVVLTSLRNDSIQPANSTSDIGNDLIGPIFNIRAAGGEPQGSLSDNPLPSIILDVRGNLRFPGNRTWNLTTTLADHITSGEITVRICYTISNN